MLIAYNTNCAHVQCSDHYSLIKMAVINLVSLEK